MTRLRCLAVLVPLALLAGCNKSNPQNDKRSATGEVLQGTTTDAMIPLGLRMPAKTRAVLTHLVDYLRPPQ